MSKILSSPAYEAIDNVIHNLWYIKLSFEDDAIKDNCQEMLNFLFEHLPDAAPKPEPILQDRR